VGDALKATSYNIVHEIKHVVSIQDDVKIPAPFSPIFLPNNPAVILLIRGINKTSMYIDYIKPSLKVKL